MKHIPRNPEIQSLAQIHEAVARAEAVLKGDFKTEIASMKQLDKQLTEKMGNIDTVEKAKEYSLRTETEANKLKEEASKIRVDAKALEDRARSKLSTVMAREETVTKRESEVMDRQREIEQSKLLAHSASEQRAKDLTQREQVIQAKEADLKKRNEALTKKEATVRALLESMSA